MWNSLERLKLVFDFWLSFCSRILTRGSGRNDFCGRCVQLDLFAASLFFVAFCRLCIRAVIGVELRICQGFLLIVS